MQEPAHINIRSQTETEQTLKQMIFQNGIFWNKKK